MSRRMVPPASDVEVATFVSDCSIDRGDRSVGSALFWLILQSRARRWRTPRAAADESAVKQ
jgi:hypothetical protein